MSLLVGALTPQNLLDCFLAHAWELVDHDDYNWTVAPKTAGGKPFVIPRKGARLSAHVVTGALKCGHGSPLHGAIQAAMTAANAPVSSAQHATPASEPPPPGSGGNDE